MVDIRIISVLAASRVEKLSDSLCFPFPEKASLWDSCLRRAEALCRLEEDGGEKLPSSPVQKY